ncbi:MAG: bifunctional methylenetetrahydrofolate dehydrogenase/methenyltetrahydrofolate cyclohydrolase FolD [Clostridia bacterium]|jgi:methylenetetrahydrofolate dehydrogenase (NADP+)/methenyltetrahydrofolate cyclohydrolase|nr:bifunctional methylenetetrahydrofolate dehydrogenase/methenyltetrahydrofolate cyclohydrolase FolD [Clostridia bacterium]MBQ6093488.1 bifunctional methylenetetrahydrofolate dehydrogenase/methenyltetrahydrofolate cyclohydrolase FolD [Clostridia bacterium]
MQILDGKAVSLAVKTAVRDEIAKEGIAPCLAVILVGNDPASRVYVNNKKKACAFCGIRSLEFTLPENTAQEELLGLIDDLNRDETVNGILCQLPVPKQISEKEVIARINPKKDVDCFHNENVGRLWTGSFRLKPCTPAGVMALLDHYGIDPDGKHCVVIGRSNIVGKPMAALMLERNATVTVCHSRTRNLKEICLQADIIVSAVGKARFLTADMVPEGAVVLDVGISRLPDGTLCGDADFDKVKEKAAWLTPVPGGCGPMTIAVLMQNTLTAYRIQTGAVGK